MIDISIRKISASLFKIFLNNNNDFFDNVIKYYKNL